MSISPSNLLDQVRNTAPFLFEGAAPTAGPRRYIRLLRDYDGRALSGAQYYEFCLAAHWATAGTFVPTDVDNAIRWRLWQEASKDLVAACVDLVLDAVGWDYTGVTGRVVRAPDGALLSTHEGTWFSVAVGAYAAARRSDPSRATAVLEAMRHEASREHAVFSALADSGDGLTTLKACALIAHNFGDLDRVADQWELTKDDPLKIDFYDAAKPGSPLFGGLLGWAGELNKRFLTADNHRHYALRAPRALRRSPDLLIPVGPFFDDWGRAVARHPALGREEVGEVARALLDGWTRLHGPVGYARALCGLIEGFPGGRQALGRLLPGADRRMLESGAMKAVLDIPQGRFEPQWANKVRQIPRPA
jgi:hypothetical protein